MMKLCSVFTLFSACLAALPSGFQPVEGEMAPPILNTDGSLTIKSGEKGVAEWDQFSIGPGEHVRFEQASVNSSFLNRVIGSEASDLMGRLSSNGAIYLINPNGILIGPGAEIEAASFIGSTLDLLNSDFLEERALAFQGDSGQRIINQGKIVCEKGDIFFIARAVDNSGELFANRVGIATGSEVLIAPKGEKGIYIRTAVTENLIQEIQEGSSYAKAIHHDGTIEAFAFEERGGEIYLVAADGLAEVEGTLIARNEEGLGGVVHVLGDKIGILDGSVIDVSGRDGGGEVLIGGDYQGKNPEIKNAQVVWMGKESLVQADAIENGDGGKVILWGDDSLCVHGRVSARGGMFGGDGGLVETSSKGSLVNTGFLADRRAPFGKAGVLLLDPCNVTISAGATTNEGFAGNTYTPTGTSPANILVTDLTDNLALGAVTVVTTGGCGEGGSITVSAPISWSAANLLTLSATTTIDINENITSTVNGGALTLTNGGILTIPDTVVISLGGAFTQNGVGLVSLGGEITTTNDAISFATDVTLTGNLTLSTDDGSGNVTFTGQIDGTYGLNILAGSGTVTFSQSVGLSTALASLQVSAGTISVSGAQVVESGPMTYTGAVTLLSTGNFVDGGASGILFSSTIDGNFNLTLQATNSDITVGGGIDLSAADLSGSAGGAFLCSAGTGVSLVGVSTQGGSIANGTGGAGGVVTASSTAGSILFSGQILTQGGEATTSGTGGLGGAVTLTASGGSVSTRNINTSGGDGVALGGEGGDITLQPTNSVSGGIPNGQIILNSDLSGDGNLVASGGSGVTAGAGGDITLSAGRASATEVATITSSLGGNDVTILGARLVVGAHEAMTVLGDLTLTLTTSATLSDTVALGDLTIDTLTVNLLTHGEITLLDYTGGEYISPTVHFIAGGAYPPPSATFVPSGPIDARGLGLTSAAFRPLLLFGSTILNYDADQIPIIPLDPGYAQRVVYLLTVADAELTDRLPIFPIFPYSYPKICSKDHDRKCRKVYLEY